ncbi:MAG TPA: hypothetical protein VGG34_10315 [Opitutaceae bacterium]|jgi:hypothetical protein
MLAALCLAAVFAISLTSYLTMCYTSLSVSTRNLMFNRGAELAEAGAEFGLYALNYGANTGSSTSQWSSPTWTTSGTTATANLTMTSSGLVATSSATSPLNYGNGMNGTVTVTVTNYNATSGSNPGPTVTSQSLLTMPGFAGSTSDPQVSQSVTYSPSSSTLTGSAPLFVNAVAGTFGDAPTMGRVRFQSAGTVDSYNSNPAATALVSGQSYSICTPGNTNWTLVGAANNLAGTVFTASRAGTGTGTAYTAYTAYATRHGIAGSSANIVSMDNDSTTATVKLNDATVYGYAVGYDYQSPATTNWFSYGTTGRIVSYSDSASTYIDSSRLITEPAPYQPIYLELPTSGYPYSSASSTLPVTVSTSGSPYYNTYLNKGSASQGGATLGATTQTSPLVYQAGYGISLGTNQIVTIEGPVVIITYGGITTTGNGGFVLDSPQASLQIFVEYGNVAIGGSTGITYSANYTAAHPTQLLPKKVAIMATTNNWSSATLSQTSPFYGVIYLPYMPVTVSMTGAAAPIYGSIVGSSVTLSASPVIHYDSALRSPMTSFIAGVPLQSGAAFDNLSTPFSFGSRVASTQ